MIGQLITAGLGLFEVGNLGVAEWLARLAERLGAGLGIDLPVAFGDLAMKAPIQVGVLLRRVIVVVPGLVGVPIELIQPGDHGTIRFRVPIDRIAVEGIRNRQPRPDLLLQMDGSNVVVVIIRPTAMAAVLV